MNLRDENKPGKLTIRKTNRCMRRNEIEQSAIIYQKKESYNDLDGESTNANDGRSTSPFGNSFGILGGDTGNGGFLGSAIEMSAAGAGVVPDGIYTL